MSALGYVSAGLAAAAVVAGIARYLLDRRRRHEEVREKATALGTIEAEKERAEQRIDPTEILYGRLPGPSRKPAADRPTEQSRPTRFANVEMRSGSGEPYAVIGRDSHMEILVDIGRLRLDSAVVDPVPFPDDRLPEEDLEIAVLLSSATLPVGFRTPGDEGDGARGVEQRLVLPADGGPSRTADDGDCLSFALGLPEAARPVRARLSYFYRDAVVQSQRLDLVPDREDPSRRLTLEVTTDFTVSKRFGASLTEISERPRVGLLVNANSPEEHEVTVRAPGNGHEPLAFTINHEAVSAATRKLREAMRDRAPRQRRRSSGDLGKDLKAIAPLANRLLWELDPAVGELVEGAGDAIVSISMPEGSGFTLPWNLIYDIPLESDAELSVCPVAEQLEDGTVQVGPETRECPHPDHGRDAENLLCPFGFWGLRKSIEVIVPREEAQMRVELGDGPRVVLGQTTRGVDRKRLADHMDHLAGAFHQRFPQIAVTPASSKAEVKQQLSDDLPFVYFLCHGERAGGGESTELRVGNGESVTPGDFEGWALTTLRKTGHRLWTKPRPLIFLNACESMAIAPEDLIGYLTAFVARAQAVGLIGTETRVNSVLAMDVGERFFDALLNANTTVDEALRQIRAAYLQSCNLFGLAYTAYCFADLRAA